MREALDVGASMIRSALHQTDLTVSSELALAHALKIALAGNVVGESLAAAAECQTDLIVMATAGRQGSLHALRGSTTERVLRDARCPVLAVPVIEGAPSPRELAQREGDTPRLMGRLVVAQPRAKWQNDSCQETMPKGGPR